MKFVFHGRKIAIGLTLAGFGLSSSLIADDASPAVDSWTQWGGENQEFSAPADDLKNTWPETGPPLLWQIEIGEGYSGVLVENGKLYTMTRVDEKESVVALDAKTGKTLWQQKYDSSPAEGHVNQFGRGPRATPLLVGDRLFTIGIAGIMHCLNKNDGKVIWKLDLWQDVKGSFLNHGYSSSPIAYGDQVIVLAGGEGHAVMSLNQSDGKVKWQSQSFNNSYATPRILELGGKDHLITFMAQQIIGMDPKTGDLEWSYEIGNQWGQNINTPMLVDGDHLFFSTTDAGSRGLKLTRQDGKVNVEELWSMRKIQFYHVTTVLEGEYVYGTTGSGSPSFMASVNAKTGKIAWRKRGFAKGNALKAGDKLFILDENGVLYLTQVSPEDLKVLAQAEVLERPAWTVPTLVGKVMYVRGNGKLKALNLG